MAIIRVYIVHSCIPMFLRLMSTSLLVLLGLILINSSAGFGVDQQSSRVIVLP